MGLHRYGQSLVLMCSSLVCCFGAILVLGMISGVLLSNLPTQSPEGSTGFLLLPSMSRTGIIILVCFTSLYLNER
jgi:hypothetical protein